MQIEQGNKKRLLLLVVIVLFANLKGYSWNSENQNDTKVDIELLTDMSNSNNDDELFSIIVVMSGQYDQMSMLQKTKYMDRKLKRGFVVVLKK